MTLQSPVRCSVTTDKVDNTDGLNQLQMDAFGCMVQGSFLTGHCKCYRATGLHRAGVNADLTPSTGGLVGHACR